MGTLDIWITKPGDACYVDDDDWTVTIFDCHGAIYEWAGTSYAHLPAHTGHCTQTLPPGTYVVQATRRDASKTPSTTEHAIVTVACVDVACVRLYVGGGDRQLPPPTIQPESGTFASDTPITLSDAVAQASIYYTTDGTDPIPNFGSTQLYTGPFVLSHLPPDGTPMTVKAIAALSGWKNSPVASMEFSAGEEFE